MDADAVARSLAERSWCILPEFFDARLVAALAEECRAYDEASGLAPASTGRGAGKRRAGLRGDRTRWFDPGCPTAPQADFFSRMDEVRVALNRRLLLGLEDLEAHYALYPPGTGYVRHLDRFRDDDARVVSTVTYLNDAWREEDGGALRLHLPQGGTLILFLSAEVEHEVLPAARERMSIAGWFRRR